MFQPVLRPKRRNDLDYQFKTDKRFVDLLKTELKETNVMLFNVDDFIHNIPSQMYPGTKIRYTWMQRRDL